MIIQNASCNNMGQVPANYNNNNNSRHLHSQNNRTLPCHSNYKKTQFLKSLRDHPTIGSVTTPTCYET